MKKQSEFASKSENRNGGKEFKDIGIFLTKHIQPSLFSQSFKGSVQ